MLAVRGAAVDRMRARQGDVFARRGPAEPIDTYPIIIIISGC